jgi:hypothetical protein
MNKYHGKSPLVVKPRDTEEVSKVVKYCYENDIAIVPQAGNTGLVGESITYENDADAKAGQYQSMMSWSYRSRISRTSGHSTLSLGSWFSMLE